MTVESTLARAQQEIELGRAWRAREILGSSIRTYGYNRRLLYSYAQILDEFGDPMEAGKYYLLTVDEPTEHELKLIHVFLNRHQNLSHRQLMKMFPSQLRAARRDAYPKFFEKHLEQMGAPAELVPDQFALNPSGNPTKGDRAVFIGCSLIACLFLLCFVVGLIEIASWLWQS